MYTVDHPELLMQTRRQRVVVFTTDDDREVALAVEHVVSLEIANSYAA